MKNSLLCALLVVSIPAIAAAQDEIQVTSAGATSIIAVGDSYSNANFNGWNISATSASNLSLSPFGINLQVNATCLTGSCLTNALNVFFTADAFSSIPAAGFATNFTTLETTGETSRAITWAASSNSPFLGGVPGVGADHIGTVTLAASGSGSATGSPSGGLTTPYTLTIEESFTDTTGTTAAFVGTGNVTAAAPEIDPTFAMGGLTLLAGGLAALRGRRSKKE